MGDRGGGRLEAADGLRVPRADDVVAGDRNTHDRAHRIRVQGGARPILQRHDRDPQEIRDIENGVMDKSNNPLKHAPHPASVVLGEQWDRPYSREQGAFPAEWTRASKFWPTNARIDNVYGDRNLVTTHAAVEVSVEETA